MKVTSLVLDNIRSFVKAELNFSTNVNIIIGQNNSGKSTILNAIYLSLTQGNLLEDYLRKKERIGRIDIALSASNEKIFMDNNKGTVFVSLPDGKKTIQEGGSAIKAFQGFAPVEPGNFIYPFFSSRKVAGYDTSISEEHRKMVTGSFRYLTAKIDHLMNPNLESNKFYTEQCNKILGFSVFTHQQGKAKTPAYTIDEESCINILSMGAGVPHVISLIRDLCFAKNRLFLIEEPENDIHPKALKHLLNLIIESSRNQNNQFIITTHSNIVLNSLGFTDGCKIFEINMKLENKIPTSCYEEIGNSHEERKRVLEKLGYELIDFDLWDGWLFLEESSSEKLIKDHFIKWYTPDLQRRLRTFSSRCKDEVEWKFDNFDNLFVFLNLDSIYKNKGWVIIDGGGEEAKLISKLKVKYSKRGWGEDHFIQLKEHDFEKYYPDIFESDVKATLALKGKEKQAEKIKLLDKVLSWIKNNEELAKGEFAKSASEVIEYLKSIEEKLER